MTQPRTLAELIDTHDPGWPLVRTWLSESKTPVDVLPADRPRAEKCLLALQVTTRSPLGAVALETCGLVCDRGWLRVLGSGCSRMNSDLLAWNAESTARGFLLVGHDVSGGFFAVNGGGLAANVGNVFYWAPDTLEWEDLERPYSGFLQWVTRGDLDEFYATVRWPGWERDVALMSPDEGVSFYPPLWAQGGPAAERSRRTVPMVELWHIQQDFAAQIKNLPAGAAVRLRTGDAER